MNSLPFDWQARRFVEIHMNFYVLAMLCWPSPDQTNSAEITHRVARLSCVDERFTDFAAACGVSCGPLEANERIRLISEIDALVAHAYRLTEQDLDVVFSDFTEAAVPTPYRALVRTAFDEAAP